MTCDLMNVGAKQGGLSISDTADLLGFPCTVYNGANKNKKNNKKNQENGFSGGRIQDGGVAVARSRFSGSKMVLFFVS